MPNSALAQALAAGAVPLGVPALKSHFYAWATVAALALSASVCGPLARSAWAKPEKAKKKAVAKKKTPATDSANSKPNSAAASGANAASDPVEQAKPAPASKAAAEAATPSPGAAERLAPAGDKTAQQVADGIFAFYQAQPAIAAAFTQVVTKKGLAIGLKREGMAWLKRGDTAKGQAGKMRWDYPSEEVFYFCNGDVLWSYERRERLAIKVAVKNSQIYQATAYLVGQGNLTADFNVELAASPLPDAYALKLVPKQGTQLLRSLTLVVDKATFAVRASKLIDPIGDTTDLVWRSPKYAAVDDKVFEWTPPVGVTVKDLGKAGK